MSRADNMIISSFPSGVVQPPPSKSLSHRAVICAALSGAGSGGTGSTGAEYGIENLGHSDDIDATIRGMKALLLTGTEPPADKDRTVDCRESGSTLRFLLPVAAALDGRRTAFTGRGRLMQRPLDVYAEIFSRAGVSFERASDRVIIEGRLRAGTFTLPGDISSQFVSGLLLALPLLDGDSEIHLSTPLESASYADLTLNVMRHFGVEVEAGKSVYRIPGGQRYRPAPYRVEADYSQAAFFLVAAALGRNVAVSGLNRESSQGDRAILDVLAEADAEVRWKDGAALVRAGSLTAVTVDVGSIPDLAPPIAALCCFCEGTSRIINAGRLRLKESDRLHALASELGKIGAIVREGEHSLTITGAGRLRGGAADAWGDHRIAMALAVAAIRCDEPVALSGWRSVNKSYPGFWRDFSGGTESGGAATFRK